MNMAKVHPGLPSPAAASSSSEARERYTVWMKSLVFNSNGFTVYDSHGNLAYRIDNYNSKCSSQVFLMDVKGEILCTLIKKKLRIFEYWNGYEGERVRSKKPWFEVRKIHRIFNKGSQFSCEASIKALSCIRIQGCAEKSEFQIIDKDGMVIAEVKRKQALKGVTLGDDVLSLVIVANVDHSLIMALVVVHGLMSHKI